jgi:hypothetical protein
LTYTIDDKEVSDFLSAQKQTTQNTYKSQKKPYLEFTKKREELNNVYAVSSKNELIQLISKQFNDNKIDNG